MLGQAINEARNQWVNAPLNHWNNESVNDWSREPMSQWSNEAMIQWSNEAINQWSKKTKKQWFNESRKQWSSHIYPKKTESRARECFQPRIHTLPNCYTSQVVDMIMCFDRMVWLTRWWTCWPWQSSITRKFSNKTSFVNVCMNLHTDVQFFDIYIYININIYIYIYIYTYRYIYMEHRYYSIKVYIYI